MCHEGYTGGKLRGQPMRGTSNHCGKILHNELKSGKFRGEMNTDIPERASDLIEKVSKPLSLEAGYRM
jgi:hypothetical protein